MPSKIFNFTEYWVTRLRGWRRRVCGGL